MPGLGSVYSEPYKGIVALHYNQLIIMGLGRNTASGSNLRPSNLATHGLGRNQGLSSSTITAIP